MLTSVLTAACSLAVALVCTMLVLHKDYEDGLIGRIGLSFMALAGSARMFQVLLSGFEVPINPIGVVLWIGLAIFMSRHLYRFLRWRRCGEGDWRAAARAATCGKQ